MSVVLWDNALRDNVASLLLGFKSLRTHPNGAQAPHGLSLPRLGLYSSDKSLSRSSGGSLMSNGRNGEQSTPVLVFSAAVMIALLAVTVMTFERGYTRTASYEPPPGATVLAKPHPQR